MDLLDKTTGELTGDSITNAINGNLMLQQQRLFGEWTDVDVYELNLSGTGLDGDETLEIGQDVDLRVCGRVVAIQQLVRIDPEDPNKQRELLVRRAVIRAHSATRY